VEGLVGSGYSCEYDVLDWKTLSGEVDDQLIEIFAQAETLTAVEIGRAEAFRGSMWDTFSEFMRTYDILVSPPWPLHLSARSVRARVARCQSLQRQLLGWLLTYPTT